MSYCCAIPTEGVTGSKGLLIDYVKFANFLNWKDKLPAAADQKGNLIPWFKLSFKREGARLEIDRL